MNKALMLLSILMAAALSFGTACTQKERPKEQAKEQTKEAVQSGAALFQQHCSPCHPEGGNTMNPQKTLHKKDRDANGVKAAADIVGKMRNPGPGMTKFDEETMSDAEAKEIAEYIFKTFN